MPRPATAVPSRPYILWEGAIQSETVQRLYDRYVDHLQRELLFFSQTLQFISLQSSDQEGAAALARESTAAVDALLTTALDDIRRRSADADHHAQQVGAVLMAYNRAQACRLELTSPRARRFLDLIQAADQLVQAADARWMAMDLNDRGHALELMHVRRVLARAAVGIVQQGARTHALSWFYRQRSALPLKHLAEALREAQLSWGEDGFVYHPARAEAERVALRCPLPLDQVGVSLEEAALVRDWAERGWLHGRGPQDLLGLRIVVLSAEVSRHFLTAAEVTRPHRRRLAAAHEVLLLAQARQAVAPAAVAAALLPVSVEDQRDWLADAAAAVADRPEQETSLPSSLAQD